MKKWLSFFVPVYILVCLFYCLVTVDVDKSLQYRRFIPASIAFILPFVYTTSISSLYISHLVVGLSYVITAPLFNFLTFGTTAVDLSFPYDVAFGLYIFPALVFVHFVVSKLVNHKLSAVVVTILDMLLLLPNVFQFAYYLKFKHVLTSNGTMVIYQTNLSEALEYLSSLGAFEIVSAVILPLILIVSFYKINIGLSKQLKAFDITSHKYRYYALAVVLVAVSCYSMTDLYRRIYFNDLCVDTYNYFKSIEKYENGREDILKKLVVKPNAKKSAETIVLVIGESASRNYMSAFTLMEDDTTPWLNKQKNTKNFFLINNSYACASYTVAALERALTNSNYYNDITFNQSVSIIDIAKKAGYKTYWFSNQGTIGASDTPITLVAETSDVKKWLCNETEVDKVLFDEELLRYFDLVDPNENNFIIFHLMGSHIDYQNRYPKYFRKWTNDDTDKVAAYQNSLLYTDYVLEQIYNVAKDKLNLSAMVYFSDHGSDPNRRRSPDESGFIWFRIPMFIYLSDKYKEMHSQTYEVLNTHKNAYFSNDLTYDTVCGLFDITSNYYDERNSLTSDLYGYDENNLKSGFGKKFAKDDPNRKSR